MQASPSSMPSSIFTFDDLRPAFYLIAGYLNGFFVLFFGDETGKLARTRYVSALAYVDKTGKLVDNERFQSTETQVGQGGIANNIGSQ